MNNKRFYSFLGLCQRAGQVVSGEVGVNTHLKRGKLKLIIIAEDTADNTKKTYIYEAQKNKIPILILGDKDTLGSSIGKDYRAVVGVKDKNMASNLIEIYESK